MGVRFLVGYYSLALISLTSYAEGRCAVNWVPGPDGVCYYFSANQAVNWHHAQAICRSIGGTGLATFETDYKVAFLTGYVSTYLSHKSMWWIGLSREGTGNAWVWYARTGTVPARHLNWNSGEPHNVWNGMQQECVAADGHTNGVKWIDGFCSHDNLGYICESTGF